MKKAIVKLVKKQDLERSYILCLPVEDLTIRFAKAIEEKQAKFAFSGFKRGGVPRSIVKAQEGGATIRELVSEVVESLLLFITSNQKESPAGAPQLNLTNVAKISNAIMEGWSQISTGQLEAYKKLPWQFSIEEDLAFKDTAVDVEADDQKPKEFRVFLSFETLPAIPNIDFASLELEIKEIELAPKDIEGGKASLLKNLKEFRTKDDGYKAQLGDLVRADFLGRINGEEFEGGKGEDISIEIGSKNFIPGFEEQLISLAAGDQRSISLNFPQDYSFRPGEAVVFEVKVHEVKAGIVPDWDNALAEKLGLKDSEELNQKFKEKMEMDAAITSRMHAKKKLFDKLEIDVNFRIPDSMLKSDAEGLIQELKARSDQKDYEPTASDIENCNKIAQRRVKLGLFLADVAKSNNISVTEEDLKTALTIQLSNLSDQQQKDKAIEYYSKPENLSKLQGPILEEKTVDYILTQVKLNKIKVSAEDFSKDIVA